MSTHRLRLDRETITAWSVCLAGTAVMLAASLTVKPGQSVIPFFTIFAMGYALTMIGAFWLMKKTRGLPAQEFALPRRVRRLVVTATGVTVAASNLTWVLAPMPWSVIGFVFVFITATFLMGAFLQPYQIWVFGPTTGLDEYHLGRRRQARDRAYTWLGVVTLIGLAVTAWLPPPPNARIALAFDYFWLLLSLPCCVLAWTEPDED